MTMPLKNLKSSFEKIRKDSLSMASDAQKIVTDAVHRLADHELSSLNSTYQSVLKSIKGSKKGASMKETATHQLDLMQDTLNKLIASAKTSLGIIADTRKDLTKLGGNSMKSGSVAEQEIKKVTAQARKVVAEVKAAATDARKQATKATAQILSSADKAAGKAKTSADKVVAQAKSSASKVVASAQKDAQQVVKVVKADVKAVKNRVGSVLDIQPKAKKVLKRPVIVAKPSPNSRASLATSRAKQAAGSVVKTAKETTSAVAKAVKNAG